MKAMGPKIAIIYQETLLFGIRTHDFLPMCDFNKISEVGLSQSL